MDILKTKLYNKFYHDYVHDVSSTHPYIPSLSRRTVTDVEPDIGSNPKHFQKVKTILAEQNKDQDSERAANYIRSLQDPDTFIIITGQQLGLFASPLYTIYKLITTIKLVESLNLQKSKHHYVPVFWLETEDHDFQEINHTGIFNKKFQPEQIMYQGQDRNKVSIRHYKFEDPIEEAIGRIKNSSLETEYSNVLFDGLREHFQSGMDWTGAVRSFLKELFESYGLLFFKPGDREIKEISIPFFKQLLEENDQVSELFTQTSAQLRSSGYHNQVKVIPGQTYIHFENESKQRMHLYRHEEAYGFKNEDSYVSLNEIIKKVEENPFSLSTTVISRPLLQSWLLPVAAYVAGPGEIAYWAQLGAMFDHFKLVVPCLFPRISATVVEPKINRYMSKYDIISDNLLLRKKEFIDQYYRNISETEADPLSNLHQMLKKEETQILDYLKSIDQTLIDGGKKTIERMTQTLTNFENRVLKARKEKESLRTEHLDQIHRAFFPEDMPQERYLGIIYFLNKFGPDFIDYLYKNLDSDTFDHQVIYR